MEISAATLKNTLRSEKYVRCWVFAAILLGFLGFFVLKEVPFLMGEFKAVVTYKPFRHLFGWYWVCLVIALIAHIGLLFWGPSMRNHWFVTMENPPEWMISLGGLVGVILPLMCGESMIFDEKKLNLNSIISASCYTLNVFCIYMAFLPAYDYQTVHIAIGIWASIVCLVARDIRALWARAGVYLFGIVLIFVFLMFHHWVTSETTQQATNNALSNDLRDIQNDSRSENPT